MKIAKYALLGLGISVTTLLYAQPTNGIRYNIAGYDPVRPKKVIVMSTTNKNGSAWTLKNASNVTVASGTLGASLTGTGAYMPQGFNHEIDFSSVQTEGNYTLDVTTVGTAPIKIQCQPYAFLLSQVLRTIRVRRSGSNDALDHGLSHMGDASTPTYDRSNLGLGLPNVNYNSNWVRSSDLKFVNMTGGYYDAGDYIKFTLTNAHLTYYMLRSYEVAPELFDGVKLYSTTSLDDMLDNCKWGLDYLLKTMPDANEFIIQVGSYHDHNQGMRLPENDALNGSRICYSAFSRTQMGLTVAALALGSKVFAAKGLTADATAYQNKAVQIYTAAKASTQPVAWWENGEVYYADNTWADNMELAAIELYRLTNTNTYLTDAVTYAATAGSAGWSAWSNLNLTAHSRVLPYNNTVLGYITGDLNSFQTNANQVNNRWKIPHASVWGSLYSQFSVAHGAIQYKMASGTTTYDNMGYDVIDYTFGRNAWGLSFIASQAFPATKSITSSYAQIYRLQPAKFPHGEIAEGPAPQADHSSNTTWFSPAHNPGLWHSTYNTSGFTFFEQPGDYVCMETTIGGLGDGIFLLTLATKNFCSNPLAIEQIQLSAFPQGLRWEAFGQEQNGSFELQYSTNGQTYETLQTYNVAQQGIHNYSYTPSELLAGHYRIVYHGQNGEYLQSNVLRHGLGEAENSFGAYPNPFVQSFELSAVQSGTQDIPVSFYASDGTLIDTGTIGHLPGNLGQYWAPGIYFGKIQLENSVQTIKLVKH